MQTKESTRIFGPYWNGKEEVYADPFKALRLLQACCNGELENVVKDANSEDAKLSSDAKGLLAEAVYLAFELYPLNTVSGQGITEEEALSVYKQFTNGTNKKKSEGRLFGELIHITNGGVFVLANQLFNLKTKEDYYEFLFSIWINGVVISNKRVWEMARSTTLLSDRLSFEEIEGVTETVESDLALIEHFNSKVSRYRAMAKAGVSPNDTTTLGKPVEEKTRPSSLSLEARS